MTSEGIVYMVRAKGTDHYKIGYTSQDVDKRVSSLQTGCPHELEAVATWPGTLDDESELHELLDEFRGIGEWFEMTVADPVKFVREKIDSLPVRDEPDQQEDDVEWICEADAAQLMALTSLELAEMRETGTAPTPYRKAEDGQIFYSRKTIDSWVLWRIIHVTQGSDIAGLPDSAKRGAYYESTLSILRRQVESR